MTPTAWAWPGGLFVGACCCLLAAWGAGSTQSGRQTRTTKLVPRIHGMWVCPNSKHHVHIFNTSVQIDRNGADYLVVDGHMDKALKSVSKFSVIIHRCNGGVSSGLCEYFLTWNWVSRVCGIMVAKGAMWTYLVESISPEWKCPARAGDYHIGNGTLDFNTVDNILHSIHLEKFTWKVEAQLYDELNELTVCAYFIGELRRVKIKKD